MKILGEKERYNMSTYLDDLRVKKEIGPSGDKLGIKLPGDVSETSEIRGTLDAGDNI